MEPPPSARPLKALIIPQTVPNKPTKGVRDPIVAKIETLFSIFSVDKLNPCLRDLSTFSKPFVLKYSAS